MDGTRPEAVVAMPLRTVRASFSPHLAAPARPYSIPAKRCDQSFVGLGVALVTLGAVRPRN